MRLVFDMETRDPDDALTLCLVATHPAVELAAVTINPGTRTQVAVVRRILDRLGVNVPIGSRHVDSQADALSPFHVDWLGALQPSEPDGSAVSVLAAALTPDTTLLTGAPLQSLRRLLRERPDVSIGRWVGQGGFAGDSLVEPAHRVPDLAGRETCESHNFGVDAAAAEAALRSERIARRELVGKNVTHGVTWDRALHTRLAATSSLTAGARLAVEAMDVFLVAQPIGKWLHDPLAAVAAIDPDAFRWIEADVYRDHGRWGSRACAGTGTFVAVAVDRERALTTMFAPGLLPSEAV